MKKIVAYSPEAKAFKVRAILTLDRPLLKDLQALENETFIYVESFFDALKASTLEGEDELPTIESTAFKESFLKPLQPWNKK